MKFIKSVFIALFACIIMNIPVLGADNSYTVTVPAELSPGESGTIQIDGNWSENYILSVSADNYVKLENNIDGDTKFLEVEFPGIAKIGGETVSVSETFSIENISDALFGVWSGEIQFYITLDRYTDATATLYSDGNFVFSSNNTLAEGYSDSDIIASYKGSDEWLVKTYNNVSQVPWVANMSLIKKVSFLDEISPISTAYWFYEATNLKSYDGNNLNGDKLVDMQHMFDRCSTITSIDLGNLNTSNVTNMRSLFNRCTSLESLDVSCLDTSNVKQMAFMFIHCESLRSLDVSNFVTNNVIQMQYMFQGCYNLIELDVSNFNTDKVTHFHGMFSVCKNLQSLDISNFNMKSALNNSLEHMFEGCYKLKTVKFGDNSIPSQRVSLSGLFYGCSSLTDLDLSSFDTSKVTNMSQLFYGCKSLKSIDLSNFNTSNATNMSQLFYGCSSLTDLDLSSFDTSNVTNMSGLFDNCANLNNIIFGENFTTANVIDFSQMFHGCNSLKSIDLSNFNTSNATNMRGMFNYCEVLENIDVSHFDTSKVTSFRSMFRNCWELTEIDISNFKSTGITDSDGLKWMFSNIPKLKTIYLDESFAMDYLPMAGSENGLFYQDRSITITVFDASESIQNYDFTMDNCTLEFKSSNENSSLLSLDTNGGISTMTAFTATPSMLVYGDVEHGEIVDLSDAVYIFEREGYELIGFSTNPNATEGDFFFEMPAEDTIVYAIWREIVVEDKCTCGSETEVHSEDCPLYEEHEELGSEEEKILEDEIIEDEPLIENDETVLDDSDKDEIIAPEDSITTPSVYTIKFDANGGLGSMAAQEVDGTCELDLNDFTYDGYMFVGWSLSPNGDVIYEDGDLISNLTSDIVLYAVWEVNSKSEKELVEESGEDIEEKEVSEPIEESFEEPIEESEESVVDEPIVEEPIIEEVVEEPIIEEVVEKEEDILEEPSELPETE